MEGAEIAATISQSFGRADLRGQVIEPIFRNKINEIKSE
jgi:hypothetical protein